MRSTEEEFKQHQEAAKSKDPHALLQVAFDYEERGLVDEAIEAYKLCYPKFRVVDTKSIKEAADGLLRLALKNNKEAREALKRVVTEYSDRKVMLMLASDLAKSEDAENQSLAIHFYELSYLKFRSFHQEASCLEVTKGLLGMALKDHEEARKILFAITRDKKDFQRILEALDSRAEVDSLKWQKNVVDLYFEIFRCVPWKEVNHWKKAVKSIEHYASLPNKDNENREIIIYAKLKLVDVYWEQWKSQTVGLEALQIWGQRESQLHDASMKALQASYATLREIFYLAPVGMPLDVNLLCLNEFPQDKIKESLNVFLKGEYEVAAGSLMLLAQETKTKEKITTAFVYEMAGTAFEKTSDIKNALEAYKQAYRCLRTYYGQVDSEGIVQKLCILAEGVLISRNAEIQENYLIVLVECLSHDNYKRKPDLSAMLVQNLSAVFNQTTSLKRSTWLTLAGVLGTAMIEMRGQPPVVVKSIIRVFLEFESRVSAIKDRQTLIELYDKLADHHELIKDFERALSYREQAYRLSNTPPSHVYPEMAVVPDEKPLREMSARHYRTQYVRALMHSQETRMINPAETKALAELMREGPLPEDGDSLTSLGDRFIRAELFDVAAKCYLALVDKKEIPLLIRLTKLEVLKKLIASLPQEAQEKLGVDITLLNNQIIKKAEELEEEHTLALAQLMRHGPLPKNGQVLSSLGDKFIRAELFDVAAKCYLALVDKKEIPLLVRLSKLEVLKKWVTDLPQDAQKKLGIDVKLLNKQIIKKTEELEKEFKKSRKEWDKQHPKAAKKELPQKETISRASWFAKKNKAQEPPSVIGAGVRFTGKTEVPKAVSREIISPELTPEEEEIFKGLEAQVDAAYKKATLKVKQKTVKTSHKVKEGLSSPSRKIIKS